MNNKLANMLQTNLYSKNVHLSHTTAKALNGINPKSRVESNQRAIENFNETMDDGIHKQKIINKTKVPINQESMPNRYTLQLNNIRTLINKSMPKNRIESIEYHKEYNKFNNPSYEANKFNEIQSKNKLNISNKQKLLLSEKNKSSKSGKSWLQSFRDANNAKYNCGNITKRLDNDKKDLPLVLRPSLKYKKSATQANKTTDDRVPLKKRASELPKFRHDNTDLARVKTVRFSTQTTINMFNKHSPIDRTKIQKRLQCFCGLF